MLYETHEMKCSFYQLIYIEVLENSVSVKLKICITVIVLPETKISNFGPRYYSYYKHISAVVMGNRT